MLLNIHIEESDKKKSMANRSTISDAHMDELVLRIEELRRTDSTSGRVVLVGIAGVPGAGKTTLALQLVDRLNALHPTASSPPYAVNVPMDGFHLPRSALAAMPDPEFAAERRGAFWTFDDQKLFQFLASVRQSTKEHHQHHDEQQSDNSEKGRSSAVLALAPSFDHAKKDPVEDDIVVAKGTQVLIMEGNYLALKNAPPTPSTRTEEKHELQQDTVQEDTTRQWDRIPSLFDLLVFVEVPSLGESTERLAKRHMAVWGVDRGVAMARASGSDFLNAQLIEQTKRNAQVVVPSLAWGEGAPQT